MRGAAPARRAPHVTQAVGAAAILGLLAQGVGRGQQTSHRRPDEEQEEQDSHHAIHDHQYTHFPAFASADVSGEGADLVDE